MIKIDNLQRAYDDFMAVKNVSFAIEKGEIAGLLGHNGAGKTTIMKMISGYLEPDAGDIEINGMDIAEQRRAVQRCIGYLPETLPVYPEMSVADYLDYAARLKGLDKQAAREEIRRAVRATAIGDKLLAPIATLSRGYKQRVGVAQAILGQPKLLILDEPTTGLDPTQTRQMRDLIKTLARDATVILSTHIMQEVDALCDRVLILRAGELVLDATLDDLRHSRHLIVASDLDIDEARALVQGIETVETIEALGDHRFRLRIAESADLDATSNRLARGLLDHHHALFELKREQRDLESVFREINEQVQQEVRDAA